MQKRTKFLTLLLALAMLVAFALPAVAAPPMGTDGTITITPPANHVLSETQYSAYKLYNLVRITGTAPNFQFVYEPSEAVKNFLKTPGLNLALYGVTANPNTNADTLALACEQFRQWLQKFDGTNNNEAFDDEELIALARVMIQSRGVEPAAQQRSPAAPGSSLQFTGLDYGWYLVTGEGTHIEGGHTKTTVSRGMLVAVPELNEAKTNWTKDAKRNLKIDVPTVKKELKDDHGNWAKETDRNVGDTIDYKITSAVPDMTGYTGYTFNVRDKMSKGLTFKTNSATSIVTSDISVTIGGVAYYNFTANLYHAGNLPPALATKVSLATDEHLLFIDFTGITGNMNAFMALEKGKEIVITYSAVLNEKAVIGKPGNPNQVILEYARDPNVDGSCDVGETPHDETIVYTFDINILKVDGGDKTTPLGDAEFELRKTPTGAALWFKKNGNVYTLAEKQDNSGGAVQKLVSDANGIIKLVGLDAGTYYLVETKAPIGYNLPDGPYEVVIAHAGKGDYTVNGAIGLGHQCKVENNTGGVLPGTGGIGTYIFFGVGGGMAILLIAAFVIYKRKRTLDALAA